MTSGHGTSNPNVERTRGGRKPEENPSGGISRCSWRDMPSEMESQRVCLGECRTESGRETPNVLTLEKAEAGVLGDGCLI